MATTAEDMVAILQTNPSVFSLGGDMPEFRDGIADTRWPVSKRANGPSTKSDRTSLLLTFAIHGSVPGIPPVQMPKAAVFLVVALGSLFLIGDAKAQKAPPPRPVFCDLLNLIPGCQANPDFISQIKAQLPQPSTSINSFTPQDIATKISKLALSDFIYADALAKATGNSVTEPCWAAWVAMISKQQQPLIGPALSETVAWAGPGPQFATQAPHNLMVGQAVQLGSPPSGFAAGTTYYVISEGYTATTFELSATVGGMATTPTGPAAGGIALTSPGQVLQRPDPGLVTGVEYVSEAVQLLQSNSPIALACAPTAQAVQKDFATLAGSILSGAGMGLFKLPVAIP